MAAALEAAGQTLLVQWERCNGCGDCLAACVQEMARQSAMHPEVPRLHLPWRGGPAYVALCRQCVEPPCMDACISGAMRRASDGRVVMEEAACVGCWMCLAHCPFGAVASVGDVALKCNLCAPPGVVPPCARVCPTKALVLGPAETLARAKAGVRARLRVERRQPS